MFPGQAPAIAEESLGSRSGTVSEPRHDPQHSLQKKNDLGLLSESDLHVNHNRRNKSNFLPSGHGVQLPQVLMQPLLDRLTT